MSPPPRSHPEDCEAGPLSLSITLHFFPALSLCRSASVVGSCSPVKAWLPQGHVPNPFTSTALAQKFTNMNEGRVELGSVQLCWPASLVGPPCLQEGEPVLSPAKPGLSTLHAPSAQRLHCTWRLLPSGPCPGCVCTPAQVITMALQGFASTLLQVLVIS